MVMIRTHVGAYGHVAEYEVATGNCDVCQTQNILCLKVDTSDEEYATLQLCKPCIDGLWIALTPRRKAVVEDLDKP